jgi:hypothetical protein
MEEDAMDLKIIAANAITLNFEIGSTLQVHSSFEDR